MPDLNEMIFDYLKEQNKELSIGEINSTENFKNISRRELAQALQCMERQHDVFRNLKNGKAYYHINGENTVVQNQVRESINDLQRKLNGCNNVKNKDSGEKYLEDSFYEKLEVKNINITFDEKKEVVCDKYTMKIPDGFKILEEEGRDFVAFLPKKDADDSEYNMGGAYVQILPSINMPLQVDGEYGVLEIYSALNEYAYWNSTRQAMNALFAESSFYPIVLDTTAGGIIHTEVGNSQHYYVFFYIRDEYKQIHFVFDDVLGDESEIRSLVIQISNGFLLNRPFEKIKKLNSEYFLKNELNDNLAKEWGDLLNQKHSEAMGYLRVMAVTVEGSRREAEEAEGAFSDLKEKKRFRSHLQKTSEIVNQILEEVYDYILQIKDQNLDNPAFYEILEIVKDIIKDDYSISLEITPGDVIKNIPEIVESIRTQFFEGENAQIFKEHKEYLEEQRRTEEEKQLKKLREEDKIEAFKHIDEFCDECRQLPKLRYTPFCDLAEVDKLLRSPNYQKSMYKLEFNYWHVLDLTSSEERKIYYMFKAIDEKGKAIIEKVPNYWITKKISNVIDEVLNQLVNDYAQGMKLSDAREIQQWWKNQYLSMPEHKIAEKIENMEPQIRNFQKILQDLNISYSEMQASKTKLEKEISKLEKELEEMEEGFEEQKNNIINTSMQKIQNIQDEMQVTNQKRKENEETVKNLDLQISNLSFLKISMKRQLNVQLKELKKIILEQELNVQNMEENCKELKANMSYSLANLEKNLQEKQVEVKNARFKLSELKEKIEENRCTFEKEDNRLYKIEKECDELKEQI